MALLVVVLSGQVHGQSVDSLLSLYRNEKDPATLRTLQLQIGWQYQTEGDFAKAVAFYREALQNKEVDGEFRLPVLKNLSFCYNELGDLSNTVAVEQSILELQKQSTLPYSAIERTLQRLAALSLQQKDLDNAKRYNEELLKGAIENRGYVAITQAYNNLGYIYFLSGDRATSDDYLTKSYRALSDPSLNVSPDDRATILLNLGVLNANMGRLKESGKYLMEAYEIAKTQDDPVKIAHTLNYLASHEFIQNNLKAAQQWAEEALKKLDEAMLMDFREITLVQTYKIMAEIMFRKNDIKEFRKFNALYVGTQDQIIQKEKRKNRLFLERQVEIEKARTEIANLLNAQERQNLQIAQNKIEQETKQKEILLKNKQLEMLRKENELQEEKYLNTILKNQQINQMLELSEQKLRADQQNQKIELLEKEKELQNLQLLKRKQDIEELRKTEDQHRWIKTYTSIIIGLLAFLLIGAFWLHYYRIKKNKTLLERNETISRMNHEITAQNQQLISINDQLQIKSLELQVQNNKLNSAQDVINRQNEELVSYTRNLEEEVMRRTEQIRENSERLSEYADQLEKFTYAVSHNLRAPIARMLGLADIISSSMSREEQVFFLAKIRESATQLDDVIKDLNLILELKAEKQNELELVDLLERVNSALALHGDTIHEHAPNILIDLQVKQLYAIGAFIDSILYNLIGNALKFRDPGRKLILSLRSYRDDGHVIIRFEDNGIGIDLAKYRDKLFGLYKRFEPRVEGKGLGLYLVKSHVHALNGTIAVESSLGKGTTFIIRLPFNETVKRQERLSENALS